jgi:hypothetical protein
MRFEWHRKRAVMNYENAVEMAKKEEAAAKDAEEFLNLAISTRPESQEGFTESDKEEVIDEAKKLIKLQRHRLRRQQLGLLRYGKISRETKQAYNNQIVAIQKKIELLTEEIGQLYLPESDYDEDSLKALFEGLQTKLPDLRKHIENLLGPLQKKDLKVFACDIELGGDNGDVIFDTNILIQIEKNNSRAERFHFDVGGNLLMSDVVMAEFTKHPKSSQFLAELSKLPVVTAPKPSKTEVGELRGLWLSAGINKDLDDFLDPEKADMNLLLWGWEKARNGEKATIVSNDREIRLVAAKLPEFYEDADITVRSSSDLRIDLH